MSLKLNVVNNNYGRTTCVLLNCIAVGHPHGLQSAVAFFSDFDVNFKSVHLDIYV